VALADEEDLSQFPEGRGMEIRYDNPPTSAKLRFTYNEQSKQIRIFYGINGEDAVNEMPSSRKGIILGKPLSESTAAYIMFSNGQVDIDHLEIKPL
jgi:hypothetical protein